MPGIPPWFAEYAPLRTVAVCRPTYFALQEPINLIQANHVAAGAQIEPRRAETCHALLRAELSAAGVRLVEITPDQRYPYQINTRDAGLAVPRGYLSGRFRLAVRQGEEMFAREAALAAGAMPLGAIESGAFEGGDFVALDQQHAAVGLGSRTNHEGLVELQTLLGEEHQLLRVPFEPHYLHLDMIFNVIAERFALACREALPTDFLERLRSLDFHVLDISPAEVFQHGCNVLALGEDRILSHAANVRVNRLLRSEGFRVASPDLAELARSGGGPRCLTLPLERATRP
jgi:N-dimethylarginine dimethylaminohydrolase